MSQLVAEPVDLVALLADGLPDAVERLGEGLPLCLCLKLLLPDEGLDAVADAVAVGADHVREVVRPARRRALRAAEEQDPRDGGAEGHEDKCGDADRRQKAGRKREAERGHGATRKRE